MISLLSTGPLRPIFWMLGEFLECGSRRPEKPQRTEIVERIASFREYLSDWELQLKFYLPPKRSKEA